MHVHVTASRISEILIRNQLALIKDELLCHCHSGLFKSGKSGEHIALTQDTQSKVLYRL